MLPVPVLKSVARLDILEAIRPDILTRLLSEFGDPVTHHREAIHANRIAGVAGLHDALGQLDSETPLALKQALLVIGDLANEAGHGHLLGAARAHNIDLAADAVEHRLNPAELACVAYLDHRPIFDLAQQRVESCGVRRFVDFRASGARLDGALAVLKRAELADALSAWFAARNRTRFCEVRICESADEISFTVIHGRPPRAQGVIEGVGQSAARDVLSYVPDKHDLIIFRKSTKILSVNAQYPVEQDFYRRLFGRVFFGTENHFAPVEVYTGAPLIEFGALALSSHGIPHLSRVQLREVGLWLANDFVIRATSTKDITARLESPNIRCCLEHGRVVFLKLALQIAGRARPLLVEIVPPNRLVFDRRSAANTNVVQDFLLTRGFAKLTGTSVHEQTMTDERMGA